MAKISIIKAKDITAAVAEKLVSIASETGLSYWSVEDYVDESKSSSCRLFLLFADDEIVGFLITKLFDTEIDKVFEVEIYNIGIKRSYQGFGGGRLLLNAMINEIGSKSIDRINLEVRKKNAKAINFYRSFKFEVIGERIKYYRDPVDTALIMSREFGK